MSSTRTVAKPTSPASTNTNTNTTAPSRRGSAWLREPLLHFLLIGALVFALDAWVNRDRLDPRVITFDAVVDDEARRVFRDARGREPNADELYALRRVWLDNEVLYREGMAMQMDQGDQAIRDRVIFKALSSINAGLKAPPLSDEVLRAWFEKNRVKYDEPARFDFSEAVLPEAQPTEAQARALASQLGSQGGGEVQAGLRVFKGRPQANLLQSYGEAFTTALTAQPPGEWRAVRHGELWRVMRLEGSSPARKAEFEPLRETVVQDWTDAVMAEQRAAAVKAMAMKYSVRHREVAPAAAQAASGTRAEPTQ
ncbi:peptidylprolyl isomerase [Aquabacterium sp. OR-4]|uniref:peptidylprolyl isomerase n=1 Tax=Aquabacterium sp. OR-4 TaxID=2978127 RepID=UPI0028C79C14|nr:peptidylprolyl isomerase [Aquabacterium sp. OR-4]MDT7838919.1 peptidylprolyl isomerase [Aquabacterium sp. OR-4]